MRAASAVIKASLPFRHVAVPIRPLPPATAASLHHTSVCAPLVDRPLSFSFWVLMNSR